MQKLPTTRMIVSFRRKDAQYYLSAATGRPWSFAKDIIEKLTKDPCIVAGGTQIRSSDGKVLWQCDIPEEALQKS